MPSPKIAAQYKFAGASLGGFWVKFLSPRFHTDHQAGLIPITTAQNEALWSMMGSSCPRSLISWASSANSSGGKFREERSKGCRSKILLIGMLGARFIYQVSAPGAKNRQRAGQRSLRYLETGPSGTRTTSPETVLILSARPKTIQKLFEASSGS